MPPNRTRQSGECRRRCRTEFEYHRLEPRLIGGLVRYEPSAALINLIASSLAHSAGPAMVAISHPRGSTNNVVGIPNARPTAFRSWKGACRWVGVVGELLDPDLFQPGLRFVRVARVDIDRHHLKSWAAKALLQCIERRHFLSARHTPGGPQVEQDGTAAPVLQRERLAGGVLERQVGQS